MSALKEHMSVPKTAIIPLDRTPAAVPVDTSLTWMRELVTVSYIQRYVIVRGHRMIYSSCVGHKVINN